MSVTTQEIIDKSHGKAYRVGDITIDERFWDCECEDKYIHSKMRRTCLDCGARPDDMPDARVNEITRENLYNILDIRIAQTLGYEVSSAVQN